MIYFPFYTERWVTATQGLTACEEGLYLRLVLWMYANECALPASIDECHRIARCSTRAEMLHVPSLLRRYFVLAEGGWNQKKANEEIDRFKTGQPVRDARKAQETARKRATRNEQHQLYVYARQNGLETRPGMTLVELRELCGVRAPPYKVVPFVPQVVPQVVPKEVPEVVPKEVPHFQQPNIHKSVPLPSVEVRRAREDGAAAVAQSPQAKPADVTAAVHALRAGGLQGINAGHPLLHALVAAGAAPDAFTYAAASAVARGAGFAYALAALQGQMAQAAQATAQGLAGNGAALDPRETAARAWVAQVAPGLEAQS